MRYCESCGAPLENDALFCTKCGARLSPLQSAPQPMAENKEQKKSYKLLFFILLGIILAAGVTIVVLILGKKTRPVEHDKEETVEVVRKETVKLQGCVDTYRVHMKLTIEGNMVTGTYYYESQGPEKVLNLRGLYENSHLELFETTDDGQQTGHFKGQLKKGIFIGDFYNAQGRSMHFRLEE